MDDMELVHMRQIDLLISTSIILAADVEEMGDYLRPFGESVYVHKEHPSLKWAQQFLYHGFSGQIHGCNGAALGTYNGTSFCGPKMVKSGF
jgi:hypothetical protein